MIMNLRKEKQNYYAKRSKRWIYCVVYAIIFGVLAYGACYVLQLSTKAQFDRQILDSKLLDIMGNYNVKDALSDEVFLVSYSYNYAEPRFYTKANANDKAIKIDYDVSLDFAAKASSASPLYFDPVFRSTMRGK